MTQDTVIHKTTIAHSPRQSPALGAAGTPATYVRTIHFPSAPTTPISSPFVAVQAAPAVPPMVLPSAVQTTTVYEAPNVQPQYLVHHHPQPQQHVVETVIPCTDSKCTACQQGAVCHCASCVSTRNTIICSRTGCNGLVCSCEACKNVKIYLCAVHSAEAFSLTKCFCLTCIHAAASSAEAAAKQANAQPSTHYVHVVPADSYWAVGAAARAESEKWVSKILNYPPHTLAHLSGQEFQKLVDHAVSSIQRNPVIYAQQCPMHGECVVQHLCEAPRPSQRRKDSETWVSAMLAIPLAVLSHVTDAELNNLIDAALHKQHLMISHNRHRRR